MPPVKRRSRSRRPALRETCCSWGFLLEGLICPKTRGGPMLRSSLRLSIVFLLALSANLASAQMLPEGDLVNALRGGGYVIVVRHGATHADQADTDPLNVDQPGNEAKQRHLNDKGREAARAWKEAFRKMGIPVGRVYSSKFFRAQETARLGFGEPVTSFDVTQGGQVVSPNENNRRTAALRKMAAP